MTESHIYESVTSTTGCWPQAVAMEVRVLAVVATGEGIGEQAAAMGDGVSSSDRRGCREAAMMTGDGVGRQW